LRAIEIVIVTFGQVLGQIARAPQRSNETVQRPPGSVFRQGFVGHAPQTPAKDFGARQTGSADHLFEQVPISGLQIHLNRLPYLAAGFLA
jgi:hypothetical protein